jgi:ribokinase
MTGGGSLRRAGVTGVSTDDGGDAAMTEPEDTTRAADQAEGDADGTQEGGSGRTPHPQDPAEGGTTSGTEGGADTPSR